MNNEIKMKIKNKHRKLNPGFDIAKEFKAATRYRNQPYQEVAKAQLEVKNV